jgi:hypothetical protein
MFQDLNVGAYRNANEKFRPLGSRGGGFLDDIVSGFARFDKGFKNSTLYDPSPEQRRRDEAEAARGGGIFEHIVSNLGRNVAGEAEKGNLFGRIKDTIDKGATLRKAEEDKKWNDSPFGSIGISNPSRWFGGALPKTRGGKGYCEGYCGDGRAMKGRGPADVLRYGRGKNLSQKQLTKIILDKNKVIADLEENAYSGRGNCVDGMGNCVGEMVRRIGETLADYRRRVAEAPQRRREARREEERQAAEAAERQRIQAAYDADATRLLTELQNDPNDQFGRNEFRRMMQGMDRYNQNLSPIEIWRYFRQMMYDQHQLSYEEARPRVRPPRPIGPQLPPAVSASGLLDFEMDEDGN